MINAYEAENSLEAHMVLGLLNQEDIEGRVDGEYLQGGIGEIPVSGLIRVMVDEKDYEQAREIIKEWESRNPSLSPETPVTNKRSEIDRDFDGKVDVIHEYNQKGLITHTKFDGNFDGIFETTVSYRKGQPYIDTSDTNNDGFADLRTRYKAGNLTQVEHFSPETKQIVKRIHYHMNKQVSAEYDSDQNGTLETIIEYDQYENIKKESVRE
jgi:hypothetical protein